MTPEEVLAEMRDIHLPAALESQLPTRFAVEPFIVLAVVLAVLAGIWWRRRSLWRREARAELAAAMAEPAPEARWRRLIALLRKVARHRHATPPACVFLPPERIGEAEIETLARHLGALTGAGRPA